MKLSEAIRAGAKMRPQGFDTFFQLGDFDGNRGTYNRASCALGAAFEAIAEDNLDDTDIDDALTCTIEFDLIDTFPVLETETECPDPDCVTFHKGTLSLFNVITVLNDVHRWSRERIADWVEREFDRVNA